MRSRKHRLAKTLLFFLGSVGFVLALTFFFYDGPIHLPRMEAVAQAVESATDADTTTINPSDTGQQPAGLIPDGFQAQWRNLALDHGQIKLMMLSKPFNLSQTRHQTGSEAYEYASFLFEQMAQDVKSPELAARLQALSLHAQMMGNAVRQASDLQFAGSPSGDLIHLQVRAAILSQLRKLNPNALVTVRYNQHGTLLSEDAAKPGNQAVGDELQALIDKTNAVLHHPDAKQYPQAMALVSQESKLLRDLSSHLTLRWESTLYCQQHSCNDIATYIRVYTRQTLPKSTLAAVTAD
jgi:hypothetical protein